MIGFNSHVSNVSRAITNENLTNFYVYDGYAVPFCSSANKKSGKLRLAALQSKSSDCCCLPALGLAYGVISVRVGFDDLCADRVEIRTVGEVPVSYTHLTLPTKRIV